jgi:hypothetical protein
MKEFDAFLRLFRITCVLKGQLQFVVLDKQKLTTILKREAIFFYSTVAVSSGSKERELIWKPMKSSVFIRSRAFSKAR